MADVHWNGKTLCRGKQQGQGQQKGHGQQGQGQQQGHSEGTWGLWGASQITTLHASHRCENDRAICIRHAQFKNKQTNGCKKKARYLLSIHSTHPASSQPCILSKLCHLSMSINSPSYHPCILSTLHFINPALCYPYIYIYQPCIILSMYGPTLYHLICININPAPSCPCLYQTLHHFIHV